MLLMNTNVDYVVKMQVENKYMDTHVVTVCVVWIHEDKYGGFVKEHH